MKALFPGAGLLAGFLYGHGVEMPTDLLLLLGTIVFAYVGIAAVEVTRDLPRTSHKRESRPATSRRTQPNY